MSNDLTNQRSPTGTPRIGLHALVSRVVRWLCGDRIIYGLSTEGDSQNGWKFSMQSRHTFRSRKKAEKYIPTFEASCYDEKYFECAVPGSLKTKITAYELHG
jgi:glycine cleavage system pyridoxal-binding protein P